MAEKTNVFISYNHADTGYLDTLINIMSNHQYKDSFNIKCDRALSENPTNLYGTISKLLNQSHVAVAVITNNWLNSNNTRDEFIRAHERRKKLFCIFKKDDGINENQIPHYIKGDLRFEFKEDNFRDVVIQLCNSILSFKNHWQLKVFDTIRSLGDLFEKEGRNDHLPTYRIKHFEQKMLNTQRELDSIVKDRFSVSVSYEQSFLKTAKPYFEAAKKIYAVSLIGVSTFWSDENTPFGIKKSYLDAHVGEGKEVYRIFVFSSPIEANRYKNVLQANYKYYGQKKDGGVLLCSYASYRIFLNKIFMGDEEFLTDYEKKDFGILIYDEAGSEVHEAILSTGRMDVRRIYDLEGEENFTRTLFIDKISKRPEELEAEFGILKWQQSYFDNEEEWTLALKRIFQHPAGTKEIIHMVFFKVGASIDSTFKELISKLLSIVEERKHELKIRKYFFRYKAQNSIEALDGKFNGKLRFINDYNYSISILFQDKRYIPEYYKDLEHSEIRKEIYELLNPDVIPLYQELEKLQQLKEENVFDDELNFEADQKIQQTYRQIETSMKDKIMRFDWENYLTFERISSMKGYPFFSYSK